MIWSKTKTKTAEELGLKHAYLTKICEEHNIPTPSSSYWQQISWGRNVEKTPLPDCDVDTMIELLPDAPAVKGRKPLPASTNFSDILDAEFAKEQEEQLLKSLRLKANAGKFIIDFQKPSDTWVADVDTVVKIFPVPEVLKTRREIVLKTKAYLRLQRLSGIDQMRHPDYYKTQTHLDVNVGLDLQDRVLRLFDTIINIIEALGGRMEYEQSQTSIVFGDVKMSISISERNKRVELSGEDKYYGSKYKFMPSGMLRVNIGENWRGLTIEDTSILKIEDKLDLIVKKCLSVVKLELDRREQRRLQEIERIRQAEERRKEEEQRRKIEIQKEAERNDVRCMFNILKREMIVSFIDDVLSRYDKTDLSIDKDANSDAFIVKLKSLRNLFAIQHSLPIESILSESDIDSMACEFFGVTKSGK